MRYEETDLRMDKAPAAEHSKMGKSTLWIWGLGIGPVILVLLYLVLGWFDNATELTPDHDNILRACFAIAGLSGLVSGVLCVLKSKGLAGWRRAGLALSLGFLGFLAVFLVSSRTANIVEGLVDFPPSETRTHQTLLLISRAYQTHGKGRSWNIQTTPIWSNLDITEDDYEFMLAHRRVGDNARDPDEIVSKGYFCAYVTVQESGKALRVLHAGSHKLPKGSVFICPPTGSG